MPFKLRLKKSRQYNVVSKSLFVICVELLDGTTIECTLSSESVGRECLDNVCQRLGLQQPEFFGLRYVNRHEAPRWIEMERPVKKQLDKYAAKPNLYLRVMYFINGISLIHDEMTRYHYFLQLKKDVIEGRIICNLKQATMLASYSLQAEFGNYDPERHTAEYLKDFALFPKHLLQGGHLESLTNAVILQHAELAGLPQGTAEEYYILAAQQLEGYGQETFLAKDDCGSEVVIGIALIGIHVIYDNNNQQQLNQIYRWKDITNVVNHKRNFGMELHEQADPVQFQLPDIETAKYIWRMCVHQHTFFIQNENAASDSGSTTQTVRNLFSQLGSDEGVVNSSHEELDRVDQTTVPVERLRAQSTSCLDLAHSRTDLDRLRSLLPTYRPAPDYETALQQKYRAGGPALYSSQPEIHQTNLPEGVRSYMNAAYSKHHFPDVTRVERLYLDQTEENHRPLNLPAFHTYSTPELDGGGGGGGGGGERGGVLVQLYKPPPPYRPNSNSTPDLASMPQQSSAHPSFISAQVSGSSPDLVCLRGATGHRLAPVPQYLLPNPLAHRTYTNLAALIDSQHIDEGANNIMYFVGRGGALLHQPTPALRQFSQRQEPIYENVPLNWSTEGGGGGSGGGGPGGGEPRSRAASIQSAPDRLPQDHYQPPPPAVDHLQRHHPASPPTLHNHTQTQGHSKPQQEQQSSGGHLLSQQQQPVKQQQHIYPQQQQVSAGTSSSSQPQQSSSNHKSSPAAAASQQSTSNHKSVAPAAGSQLSNHKTSSASAEQVNHKASSPVALPPPQPINLQKAKKQKNQQTGGGGGSQQTLNSSGTDSGLQLSASSHQSLPPVSHSLSLSIDSSGRSSDGGSSTGGGTLGKPAAGGKSAGSGGGGKAKRWSQLLGSGGKGSKSSSTLPRQAEEQLIRVPLSTTISKEALCQELEKKILDHSCSVLFVEFQKIPKRKNTCDFTTATLSDNIPRNRFSDVIPYEETRVRLSPTRENKFGYINASHITATVGSQQRFYIAGQSPLSSTIRDFWQMIWEAEVYLVVSLPAPGEEIAPYHPTPDRILHAGKFEVRCEFSQATGHCATSKLRLDDVESKSYRGIWHLQYSEWGHQGCPNSPSHFLGFLEEVSSVRQHVMTEIPAGHNKNPPTLVHCSSGVGPSAVTILSDLLLFTIDHNQELDIPRTVHLLRQQRMLMIQNISQYSFVHSLLIYYLKNSRLI